mmetsp:Transcript_23586/g.47412  ORF Transcript_23586/g.47412 Transcript_23586/m.47412 type:complete len:286 (-) Transcript_23586:321-1178(-)
MMCPGVVFCTPWMARISEASARSFLRKVLAASMRAASAHLSSASSMAWVRSAFTTWKSSKSVTTCTCIAFPSWISLSSFALTCRHWCTSLQQTGLSSALSKASVTISSWLRFMAWMSWCSASCTMFFTSVHHVTGFSFSGASGDSYTNNCVTAASQNASNDHEHKYRMTVAENCRPVALHALHSMAFFSSSWTSGTVHSVNGVWPLSFFAKTSTPCAMRHFAHSSEPPAAAWCSGVLPTVSRSWCERLCGGAISNHRTFRWPLKAAQCSGLCFFFTTFPCDSSYL